MENRISTYDDRDERSGDEPRRLDSILAELLARYQITFPEVRITIVETPAIA